MRTSHLTGLGGLAFAGCRLAITPKTIKSTNMNLLLEIQIGEQPNRHRLFRLKGLNRFRIHLRCVRRFLFMQCFRALRSHMKEGGGKEKRKEKGSCAKKRRCVKDYTPFSSLSQVLYETRSADAATFSCLIEETVSGCD